MTPRSVDWLGVRSDRPFARKTSRSGHRPRRSDQRRRANLAETRRGYRTSRPNDTRCRSRAAPERHCGALCHTMTPHTDRARKTSVRSGIDPHHHLPQAGVRQRWWRGQEYGVAPERTVEIASSSNYGCSSPPSATAPPTSVGGGALRSSICFRTRVSRAFRLKKLADTSRRGAK
jgi:hypothetical protein